MSLQSFFFSLLLLKVKLMGPNLLCQGFNLMLSLGQHLIQPLLLILASFPVTPLGLKIFAVDLHLRICTFSFF